MVVGTDLLSDGAVLRVDTDENQLKARQLVADQLGNRYTVALNRASTTPQWLQDIGGKPMSLGLDLSGGVHFLLQVDMDKYLDSVVKNTAESMKIPCAKQVFGLCVTTIGWTGEIFKLPSSQKQTGKPGARRWKSFKIIK